MHFTLEYSTELDKTTEEFETAKLLVIIPLNTHSF